MKLGPNARVLDVSSGTGGVLAIFRQLYHCEIYGVEPDVGFYDLCSFGNRAARRILRSVRSLIRLRARS